MYGSTPSLLVNIYTHVNIIDELYIPTIHSAVKTIIKS